LKTKAFIIQKFLDTAFQPLIRFLPESSDGNFEPPLELFSLEKRPSRLPDGLFVFRKNLVTAADVPSLIRKNG
jgi:hypothetical protein